VALRDKLIGRVQPLLEPGEEVREAFPARSGPNPNLVLLTWLTNFFSKYWLVAVTDRGIVVFAAASKMKVTTPGAIAARFPRGTTLGPASGALFARLSVSVEDKPLWVHRRFFKDVERADAT
jgi:hypothetical protein